MIDYDAKTLSVNDVNAMFRFAFTHMQTPGIPTAGVAPSVETAQLTRAVHFDHDLHRPTGDEYRAAVFSAENVVNLSAINQPWLVRLALAFLALHDDAGVIPGERAESEGDRSRVVEVVSGNSGTDSDSTGTP